MKIGNQTHHSTAISASNAATIVVRGHDLCDALMGNVSFTDHVWLLITGNLPSPSQRSVLDATLVAIAEHGLVPSVQASRMTLAAAPEALQGAVAAGILGCGSVILGAAETAGRLLTEVVRSAQTSDLGAAALGQVQTLRAAKRPIAGYGHPLHKGIDPRVVKLFEVAKRAELAGTHMAAAEAVETAITAVLGKPLRMNVSVGIAAVLLDAGFPLLALKGVPMLARTASLIAHLLEEQERPIGFVMSHAAGRAIDYDGQSPPGFEPGES